MSNPVASSDPHEVFITYQGLPNEMKVPILKNIHDPLDKLDILDALPSTAGLMGWDRTSLKFELIYPFIYQYLKWPYEKDHCSWKNVLNLSKVSAEFHRIVTSHYEKYIYLTHCPDETEFQDYRQEPIWRNDPLKTVIKTVSDPTSPAPPWLTVLPFGIATSLTTGGGVQLLKNLGGMVWSLEMSLIFAYHRVPGIINYLMKCLRLVPNLRRLGLADFIPGQDRESLPPLILHEEGLVLPELPKLKIMSLLGDCSNVQQWILPKYTRQLEVLDFQDCYLTENFNPSCFPKLETIHIKFTGQNPRMVSSIDGVNDLFLKNFMLSPLKVITVRLDKVNVPNIINFMITLNNFGNTLDTLEMKFGTMNGEIEDEVRSGLPALIKQLDFQKLSCLHLDCYVGPLEFLMKMPALRKLSLVTSRLEPLQRSDVNGLNFSIERDVMSESSMWKLFPVLEWFKMDTKVYENVRNGSGEPVFSRIPGIYITRKCYEKYQRHAGR